MCFKIIESSSSRGLGVGRGGNRDRAPRLLRSFIQVLVSIITTGRPGLTLELMPSHVASHREGAVAAIERASERPITSVRVHVGAECGGTLELFLADGAGMSLSSL